MDKLTCIYLLYWDIDRPYVGQTTCLYTRAKRHLNEIKIGVHCNYKILQEYAKYGVPPTIECLIQCDSSNLNYLEELFIREFNSINDGLNIISGGYSVGKGTSNSASIYSRESLIEVYTLMSDINNSYKDISNITNVALDTVKKIGQGVQHTWLHEEFPEIQQKIAKISTKDRYKNSASALKQCKTYRRIQSPSGEIYEVHNTLEFSKLHGLPNGNLCSVLLGKRNSVKGWVGIQ